MNGKNWTRLRKAEIGSHVCHQVTSPALLQTRDQLICASRLTSTKMTNYRQPVRYLRRPKKSNSRVHSNLLAARDLKVMPMVVRSDTLAKLIDANRCLQLSDNRFWRYADRGIWALLAFAGLGVLAARVRSLLLNRIVHLANSNGSTIGTNRAAELLQCFFLCIECTFGPV